ncbi:MAG: GAF domain-containing protein [Candidatus Cloacimonetes bacterium]|nr:GAF domain-containing protein [Candidatus Cloacimonadota bacterium]
MRNYTFSSDPEINEMLNTVVDSINFHAQRQLEHIKQLTQIGEALSSENDINKILDLILQEALEYTNSDGATIYTVSPDNSSLEYKLVYNRSMKLHIGGSHGKLNWPVVKLFDENGEKILKNMVSYVYHTKKIQNFDDVYKQNMFDTEKTRETDKMNNYRCKSMVAIPLKNHESDILGVIQLINAMDKEGNVVSFSPEHIVMLNSLASQAAISLSNKKLIEDLEKLIRQVIKAIALAVDRKSKYTGGHISKVANLTEMISHAINEANSGRFKNLTFSDNEITEISIAGWMHDVGKITTPEYIMDKGTKLEKLMDGMELVRLRIEMLKQVILKESHKPGVDDESRSGTKALLEKINGFIPILETANTGNEYLADSIVEQLTEIYEFKYVSDGTEYFVLTDDEYKNLCIRKGTFTPEERDIMNNHAQVSWEILSQLQFPKKYKNVAIYAASHHEKLNGKGYPKHLKGDELPIQSRILAVADMFEALTASDRPYKKGKHLTETFKILGYAVKAGEIDGDVVEFLLDSDIYLNYARHFMIDENGNLNYQIDTTDKEELRRILHESSK